MTRPDPTRPDPRMDPTRGQLWVVLDRVTQNGPMDNSELTGRISLPEVCSKKVSNSLSG